jgi:hypothetical protein
MTGELRFARVYRPVDDGPELCLVRHPLWFIQPGRKSARCSIPKAETHEIHTWSGLLYWRIGDTGWMHGPERAPDDQKTMG